MVKSKINSSIEYNVRREIDSADIGYESSIYPFRLYEKEVEIALGKPKYEFSSKYGVVYFPVYLVISEEPVSCIGVYEIENNRVLHSFIENNEEEEMELKANHILISISKEYFLRILKKIPPKDMSLFPIHEEKEEKEKEGEKEEEEEEKEGEGEEEEESYLALPKNLVKETSQSSPSTKKSKPESLFIDSEVSSREPLPEETQEDALKLKREYKESTKNKWIEKFMKNNEYNEVDNEGGGDCLFAVIRDAFEFIGKKTTVEKLRNVLAEEATPQIYEESRSLYMNFQSELQERERDIKEIKKTTNILKKRAEKAPTKIENEEILKEAKMMVEKYKVAVHAKQETQDLLKEFAYMQQIDSFEKYKAFIKTSEYWADTWAISTLERVLNIKMIILSQQSFQSGDVDSVLQCGQLNDTQIEQQGYFRPDYYIMASYSGKHIESKHYMLITYKNHRIFTFKEVPYDVKILVINKCMERNAGPYYLIQDFRNLKTKFGLNANQGEPTEEEEEKEEELLQKDLFEKDVVFVFHGLSNGTPKAGKGSGEQIAKSRLLEFNVLNKISDWRKQLDDSWISAFEIDGRRWSSVEHYFLGSQYKKGFPDFFQQFSLDSKSDMSKDIILARAAASKSGKHNDIVLRNRKIKPDPDFYEIRAEPRYMQERRIALYAKFSQNLDLKHTLLETHRAKLVHFVRGREPEVDIQLMQLRKDFIATSK
jgi:predicted NAD-dependent protein-ADP-ribosyltransferase YbiA (DUF1768 family)